MHPNSLFLEALTCHLFFGGFSCLTLLKHISQWVGTSRELAIKGVQVLIIAASWNYFKKTPNKNGLRSPVSLRVMYGAVSAFSVYSSHYSMMHNEISTYVVGELLLIPLLQIVFLFSGLDTRKRWHWYGILILMLAAILTFLCSKMTEVGAYAIASELSFLASQQMGIHLAKMDFETEFGVDSEFDALSFHADASPFQALTLFILAAFSATSFPLNMQSWEEPWTQGLQISTLFTSLGTVNHLQLIKWTVYIIPLAHIAISFLVHTKFWVEACYDTMNRAYHWSLNFFPRDNRPNHNVILLFQVFMISRLLIAWTWLGLCSYSSHCIIQLSLDQLVGIAFTILGSTLISSGDFNEEEEEGDGPDEELQVKPCSNLAMDVSHLRAPLLRNPF